MPVVDPNYEEKPPLKPGLYRATIIACEQKTSKKGNPYLNWKFETEMERQWVWLVTAFSGEGAQMFKKLVQAAYMPTYEKGPINTDDLIGRTVQLQLDQGLNQDGSPSKYMAVIDLRADEDSFDSFTGEL